MAGVRFGPIFGCERSKEVTMAAKGSAEWKGDVPTGTGTFTAGDTISGGYTYKSRFEDGPGSNPEQLIAARTRPAFPWPCPTFWLRPAARRFGAHRRNGHVETRRRRADHHECCLGHRREGARARRGGIRRTGRGGQGRLSSKPSIGRRARDHPRSLSGSMMRIPYRLIGKPAIGSGAIAVARTMGARCSRSGSWRRSGRR